MLRDHYVWLSHIRQTPLQGKSALYKHPRGGDDCYQTIMFGRVTYARRRCKGRAVSVYLTHILLSMGSCSLRSNERIHLYSFFCVSFTRVICYDQLTLVSLKTTNTFIRGLFWMVSFQNELSVVMFFYRFWISLNKRRSLHWSFWNIIRFFSAHWSVFRP